MQNPNSINSNNTAETSDPSFEQTQTEILSELSSKRTNYSKVAKLLITTNSKELYEKAFDVPEKGGPTLFLVYSNRFMPLDYEKHGTNDIGETPIPAYLASKTLHDRPNSSNSEEDYIEAVRDAQIQYKTSITSKLISYDDREAWRQTLCVNALSESAGADTKNALEIMSALKKGIDVTKPDENGKFPYLVNDPNVRTLVLRYSDKGPEFYRDIIGDSPSKSEQKTLSMELARRKTGAKFYHEVPEKILSIAESQVNSYYESLKSSKE